MDNCTHDIKGSHLTFLSKTSGTQSVLSQIFIVLIPRVVLNRLYHENTSKLYIFKLICSYGTKASLLFIIYQAAIL